MNNTFVMKASTSECRNGSGGDCVYVWFQGKMKSIFENTKNLLDPTPCFDSHICKNASKITSVTSYRAFEHTQVNISHALGVLWLCLYLRSEAWL